MKLRFFAALLALAAFAAPAQAQYRRQRGGYYNYGYGQSEVGAAMNNTRGMLYGMNQGLAQSMCQTNQGNVAGASWCYGAILDSYGNQVGYNPNNMAAMGGNYAGGPMGPGYNMYPGYHSLGMQGNVNLSSIIGGVGVVGGVVETIINHRHISRSRDQVLDAIQNTRQERDNGSDRPAYASAGETVVAEQTANIHRLQRENHARDSNDRPPTARHKDTRPFVINQTGCAADFDGAKVQNDERIHVDIATTQVTVESTTCQKAYKQLEPGLYALVCK